MFPEDSDLKMALNMIKIIKKANPRRLFEIFQKFTSDYKEQILLKDENFFLKHDFTDLAQKTKQQDYAFSLVNQIKLHWAEMSEESKEASWNYFIVLFKLSDKIIETSINS
jgi:tetraacyldisaccharide-1-P 4'-kinase